LFQRELANVRAVAQEREAVNRLVDERFALARFGGDQQRLTAARNLEQIEREISRVQDEIQKARRAGDNEAAAAGAARLAQLDQVAAQERDIASGRVQLEQEIARQRQEFLKQVEQQQQQIAQQQKKSREEQAKAAEAEFQRQRTRIRELNTLGAGVIQGVDLRSNEGASLFQQLTANAQDPALIEARLQTRRLGELVGLVERLTSLPVRTIGLLGVG
jgi:DNA repair exonuclease SbcCD ATPase subunit